VGWTSAGPGICPAGTIAARRQGPAPGAGAARRPRRAMHSSRAAAAGDVPVTGIRDCRAGLAQRCWRMLPVLRAGRIDAMQG
jgi:hypothetical protein